MQYQEAGGGPDRGESIGWSDTVGNTMAGKRDARIARSRRGVKTGEVHSLEVILEPGGQQEASLGCDPRRESGFRQA